MATFLTNCWILVIFFSNSEAITTAAAFRQECANYKWIRDEDRSIRYQSTESSFKCDINKFTNGDWFRFGWPAGTGIPQVPPRFYRCGSHVPGWAMGEHPTDLYQRKSVKICFPWHSNGNCLWSLVIQVTKCNGFFVYQLKPVPVCFLRYCGNGKKGSRDCHDPVTCTSLSKTMTSMSATITPDVINFTTKRPAKMSSVTATPDVDVKLKTTDAPRSDTVSIAVIVGTAAVFLCIVVFSYILVRTIKKKRSNHLMRSDNPPESSKEAIVLDATLEYSSPDDYGYLTPIDGRKESFYQGLKMSKDSFYQPLDRKLIQSTPKNRTYGDYAIATKHQNNTQQTSQDVNSHKTQASYSPPKATNDGRSRDPHSPNIQDRVYNALDQNTLKNRLAKKKPNRSLSTENRNSLYSEIEENDLLKPVGPRKRESAPRDLPDYAVLEGPYLENNKNSATSVFPNKVPSFQASEYALPFRDQIGQDCGKEPTYYVLETSNPSSDSALYQSHLYDVLEGSRKDSEGSTE